MHKVFITNFQDKNFSPAKKYGEVIFVTKGFMPLDDMEDVRSSLSKYVELSSPQDFVILIGPSVIIAMFTVLWFQKHGFMNVLSWDNKNMAYRHFVIGVDSVTDGNS